jgi:hypothetical protein
LDPRTVVVLSLFNGGKGSKVRLNSGPPVLEIDSPLEETITIPDPLSVAAMEDF